MKTVSQLKRNALWILILFHVVGLVGIGFMEVKTFAALTPLNLLLTTMLVWISHQPKRSYSGLIILAAASMVLGYLVELLGTQTGFPFGSYTYGPSLGVQLGGVPLIIGVNWFLMLMGSGFLIRKLVKPVWARVVGGALLMTLVDLFIEPVAPLLDFWYWKDGFAPFVNYLGWFGVSVLMHIMMYSLVGRDENKLAPAALLIMLTFFISLNLLL